MVTIRAEQLNDISAREAILAQAFGPQRFRKTAEKLRRGYLPADGLAFAALGSDGQLVGTLRLWNINAGSTGPALLLGPLAVSRSVRKSGIGKMLMDHALNAAREAGHRCVLLVGDHSYYSRFGFDSSFTSALQLPGPVERARFLGIELQPGALAGAQGMIGPTGRLAAPSRKAA